MPESGKIVDMAAEKSARQIEDHSVIENAPDKDTLLYFVGQIIAAEAARDIALKPHKDKIKSIKRAAKDHGLFMEELKLVMMLMTTEMDETPEVKTRRIVKYLGDAGLLSREISGQLDMFQTLPASASKNDKLEEQGYQLGLLGKSVPHEEGSDAWQAMMVGWNKGQQVLKDRFKGASKPKPEPKEKAKPKAEPKAKKPEKKPSEAAAKIDAAAADKEPAETI